VVDRLQMFHELNVCHERGGSVESHDSVELVTKVQDRHLIVERLRLYTLHCECEQQGFGCSRWGWCLARHIYPEAAMSI